MPSEALIVINWDTSAMTAVPVSTTTEYTRGGANQQSNRPSRRRRTTAEVRGINNDRKSSLSASGQVVPIVPSEVVPKLSELVPSRLCHRREAREGKCMSGAQL